MAFETVLNVEIASTDGMMVVRLGRRRQALLSTRLSSCRWFYWDNDAGAFKFDTKNDKRFAHWFAHIREVLENEMNVRLRLVSTTTWSNVPDDVQREIELAAG